LQQKIFNKIRKILPYIGIILLIYTIFNLDIYQILNAFTLIKPIFIIFSLSLTLPRLLIRNYVWRMIQKEHNINLSFFQSLKIFLIGYFYGSFTPGYIGQLMRVPYMKEKTGEPYGKLFVNSFIETIVHSVSLFSMIFIGTLLVLGTFPELFYIVFLWIIIMGFILIYFYRKDRGEKIFHLLIKYFIPKKQKKNFYRFVNTFYTDFTKFNGC